MKIRYNLYRISLLFPLFAATTASFAQTVNTGRLYIGPDTKFSTVAAFDNKKTGTFNNDGDSYMYSHFNNDGSVGFIEYGGLTRFVGTNVQELTGAEQSDFFDVLFDNTSSNIPFQLYGNIAVTNESIFQNGVVDGDDFGGLFIFEEDAFHSHTSDYSHVDGYVLRNGESYFQFPIGDGGYYRYAALSESLDRNMHSFEAKYTFENSNTVWPHENREEHIELIDDAEYWILNRVSGEMNDMLLTLSWRTETTPSAIISSPEEGDIHIVRWDNEHGIWVDEGGLVDESEQTVTTAVSIEGIYTFAKVKSTVDGDDCVTYNAISPDANDRNELFRVECADDFPDNNVTIYNRWGVKVFDRDGYNNNDVAFRGLSEGRVTLRQAAQLPTGTYFYVIRFFNGQNPGRDTYKGFLYIQN